MLAQRFVERVVPLCITFFLFRLRPLPVPPFYGNLNALNLGAVAKPWHSGTTMLQGSSQALNVYRVSCSQSAPNTVQLAVAARFVAQVLSPLRGSILAGEYRGGLQIRSGFNQVISRGGHLSGEVHRHKDGPAGMETALPETAGR